RSREPRSRAGLSRPRAEPARRDAGLPLIRPPEDTPHVSPALTSATDGEQALAAGLTTHALGFPPASAPRSTVSRAHVQRHRLADRVALGIGARRAERHIDPSARW